MQYDFDIKYVQDESNKVADALLHLPTDNNTLTLGGLRAYTS